MDLQIDTRCFVFISLFVEERSVLPQISLWPVFHLPCIQIVKMEGVQPLGENAGNAPGQRFQAKKLLLWVSVILGLVLLPWLTYICLHFTASQVRYPLGTWFPPAHADGSTKSCKGSLGNNLITKLSFFGVFFSSLPLSDRKVWLNTLWSLFSFPFFSSGSGGHRGGKAGALLWE